MAEGGEDVALEPDSAVGVLTGHLGVYRLLLDARPGDRLEGEDLAGLGGVADEEDDALGPTAEDGDGLEAREVEVSGH